jgi:hypothetical protein
MPDGAAQSQSKLSLPSPHHHTHRHLESRHLAFLTSNFEQKPPKAKAKAVGTCSLLVGSNSALGPGGYLRGFGKRL